MYEMEICIKDISSIEQTEYLVITAQFMEEYNDCFAARAAIISNQLSGKLRPIIISLYKH